MMSEDKPSGGMTYRLGGLEMDDERKQVYMDGQLIKMTPLEYNILLLLMKHPERSFPAGRYTRASGTRTAMLQKIQWQYIFVISVRRLRSIRRSLVI